MSKIVARVIKLTFAKVPLVIDIGIHNCLTLPKIVTFYVVYDTFKAVTKRLKLC